MFNLFENIRIKSKRKSRRSRTRCEDEEEKATDKTDSAYIV